ncbi:variable surface lipoprotein [Metamycoplasma neophronis]|uniref:Variable surface lipoprotein n=1 Tax=Metamycoplasma neophronis TaxID=872983 RepID=A0ABY2YZE3_9BACT|nr:variable surface lipoprotein [Metamycoplasma neophronis]TPR53399.1 variable surface lipoprotein [Metamycoplasma neophronis]
MKKTLKFILTIGSISSFATLPLVAAACDKTDDKKDKNDDKTEMVSKLGLQIATHAKDQSQISPAEVVKQLKAAQNWNQVLEILTHFGVKYDASEAPENAQYSINASTHAHLDEGEIHLDITQTLSNGEQNTARFTILGFKEEALAQQMTFGGYTLTTTAKNKASAATVKNEIINAQNTSFENLINVLKKYIDITVDETKANEQFKFDVSEIDIEDGRGQIEFKKVLLYNNQTPDQTTVAPSQYVISNLNS